MHGIRFIELIGSLRIQSEKDIDKFMDKYQKEHATATISFNRGGVHLHTIRWRGAEETFQENQKALPKKVFCLKDNEKEDIDVCSKPFLFS